MDAAAKLIDLAENQMISWESIARECLAQMNCDECESVATALDIDEDL